MALPLSSLDRMTIVVTKLKFNWRNKRIADFVGCNRDTVADTLKRYEETDGVKDRMRKGRPPLIELDTKNANLVSNAIKQNRYFNIEMLAAEVKKLTKVSLSPSTFRRLAYRLRFRRVSTSRRPLLSPAHIEKRFEYAKSNQGEEWDDVIFSDEKFFEFPPKQRVWKHADEPEIPSFVPSSRHKWMVWGGVWMEGRTRLHISDDSIDAEEYQNILWSNLIEPRHDEYLRLLQDNALPHSAASTMDFLDNFEVEMVENYPPNSPDLNPIEKVWGWMVQYINNRPCQTPDSYEKLIEESWDAIPQSVIAGFISHTPSEIQHILDTGGKN
jgi:transposase